MKKYLTDGQEIEVVQQLEDGKWLAFRYFEVQCGPDDFCEDIMEDFPIVVKQVFDTPPKPKIAEDVVKQQARLKQIYQTIYELYQEYSQKQKTHEERMAKYKRYEALKSLDDFLEDKVTHYVLDTEYGKTGRIVEIDEYLDNYEGKKRRLLSLFGDSKGDLEWRLSHYADASGSHELVWPFCSYEDAHDFLQSRYDKLDVKNADIRHVKDAAKDGFVLPRGYRDAAIEKEKQSAEKILQRKESELKEAKDWIDEINKL